MHAARKQRNQMKLNNQTTTTKKSTIAFFLDYENMQYSALENSFQHCAESSFWPGVVIDALERQLNGTVSLRVCYGDQMFHTLNRQHPALGTQSPWERVKRDRRCQEALLATGFTLFHTPGGGGRKNFADITMALDCMERLGQNPRIDYVAIASQDSDFTPLFRKIKELGKEPVLVTTGAVDGNSRSMRHLRALADSHIEYNQDRISDYGLLTLDRALTNTLDRQPKVTRDGVALETLEASMQDLRPGFAAYHLGYGSFREFLEANIPQDYNLVGNRLFIPEDQIAPKHRVKRRDDQERVRKDKTLPKPTPTSRSKVSAPKSGLRKRESTCERQDIGTIAMRKRNTPKVTQSQAHQGEDSTRGTNGKPKPLQPMPPADVPTPSKPMSDLFMNLRELSVIFNGRPRKRGQNGQVE